MTHLSAVYALLRRWGAICAEPSPSRHSDGELRQTPELSTLSILPLQQSRRSCCGPPPITILPTTTAVLLRRSRDVFLELQRKLECGRGPAQRGLEMRRQPLIYLSESHKQLHPSHYNRDQFSVGALDLGGGSNFDSGVRGRDWMGGPNLLLDVARASAGSMEADIFRPTRFADGGGRAWHFY